MFFGKPFRACGFGNPHSPLRRIANPSQRISVGTVHSCRLCFLSVYDFRFLNFRCK